MVNLEKIQGWNVTYDTGRPGGTGASPYRVRSFLKYRAFRITTTFKGVIRAADGAPCSPHTIPPAFHFAVIASDAIVAKCLVSQGRLFL